MLSRLNLMISERAASVDMSCFDSVDFYDQLQDINANTAYITDTIFHVIDTLRYSIQFLVLFCILCKMNFWLTLLLVIAMVPSVLAQNEQIEAMYAFDIQNHGLQRKMQYISSLFVSREFAKDIRCYNLFGWLGKKYRDINKSYLDEKEKKSRKFTCKNIVMSVFSELTTIIYLAFLIWKKYSLDISFEQFMFYQGILFQVAGCLITLLFALGQIRDGSTRIQSFLSFLTFENKVEKSGGLSVENENFVVEFRDVWFKYEGQEKDVQQGVSFVIHSGEKVALVGKNGEGKSTIVKLLLRFYNPTKGEILLNGVNIQNFDLIQLRKRFAVIMQDYCNYAFTLGESVALSDYERMQERESIYKALEMVGEVINDDRDLDTYLSRVYEEKGEELSGGLWQRIALARALFQRGNFYIFDEPSASLDPEAEQRLFSDYHYVSSGKSMLLISHRLANVKSVDTILVLCDGKIVEKGSHESLMTVQGEYYRLFNLQAERYMR